MADHVRDIKTSMDAMQEIKSVLDSSAQVSGVNINGEVRIASRKLNSTKEDIIINTATFSSAQIQEGVFNVNVHLPNLKGQASENPTMIDNTQPNLDRIIEIGNAVVSAMNEAWLFDSHFSMDNGAIIERDANDWYVNIRVRYYALRQ